MASKAFEAAINDLANAVPNGRLLAATSGTGLLSAAASEIRDLRAEAETLLRERNQARANYEFMVSYGLKALARDEKLKDDLVIVDNCLVTAATVDGLTVTNVELDAWERIRRLLEGPA